MVGRGKLQQTLGTRSVTNRSFTLSHFESGRKSYAASTTLMASRPNSVPPLLIKPSLILPLFLTPLNQPETSGMNANQSDFFENKQ